MMNQWNEPHGWKSARSFTEIAELVESTIRDNRNLEHRIVELLQENSRLRERSETADTELTREKLRLGAEITALKNKMAASSTRPNGEGGYQSEFAAREKLLRKEFEERVQMLQLQLKKERHDITQSMVKMKHALAGCMCGATAARLQHIPDKADVLPTSWMEKARGR